VNQLAAAISELGAALQTYQLLIADAVGEAPPGMPFGSERRCGFQPRLAVTRLGFVFSRYRKFGQLCNNRGSHPSLGIRIRA